MREIVQAVGVLILALYSTLRADLKGAIDDLGTGEVVVLSDTEYGIAVGGSVVSIRRAVTNPDVDWHLVDFYYCS